MVIPVQPDQIETALDAISRTSQTANQYTLGFMLLIFLFMVVGGIIIAVVMSRAANKYIDANAKNQISDNTLQKQVLETWAQSHIDNRENTQAVRVLTETMTPMVKHVGELAQSITLHTKQTMDGINQVSGTVAVLSGRVDNVEGTMSDVSQLLSDVVARLTGVEAHVKQANCEPHATRILDAIEKAKREIIEFKPLPPTPPAEAAPPKAATPLNADGAAHNATVKEDAA